MDMSVIKLDGVVFVETIVEVAGAVRNGYDVVLAKSVCLSLYWTKPIRTHQNGPFLVIPDSSLLCNRSSHFNDIS